MVWVGEIFVNDPIYLFNSPRSPFRISIPEMASPWSFTTDSDWGLFSASGEDYGNVSLDEMTEIHARPFTLDTRISEESQYIKPEDNFSNDEYIKLEDLYDGEAASTQSSKNSLEFHPQQDCQIPEFDQLQNLPHIIVERPRYFELIRYLTDRAWVQEHLQCMLDDVGFSLECDIPIVLHLRNRSKANWTRKQFIPGPHGRRFRCLIRVIEIIMQSLANNDIITKRLYLFFSRGIDGRAIYYRDPMLFRKQGVVDKIVDVLAYTLLVPRSCLHVVNPFQCDLTIRLLLPRV